MSKAIEKAGEAIIVADALARIIDVIRHPFQRDRTTCNCGGESLTHQSHKDACDVNNIVRKFDNTGIIPVGKGEGQYGDVTALQRDLTEQLADAQANAEAVNEVLQTRDKNARKEAEEAQAEAERLAQIKALKAQLDSLESPPAKSEGQDG